jgi:ribosomal protein L21
MDQVLLVGTPTQTKLGAPHVQGAYVETIVEQQTLSDKVKFEMMQDQKLRCFKVEALAFH